MENYDRKRIGEMRMKNDWRMEKLTRRFLHSLFSILKLIETAVTRKM